MVFDDFDEVSKFLFKFLIKGMNPESFRNGNEIKDQIWF